MTPREVLQKLNDKINEARSKHNAVYAIETEDEVMIHMALNIPATQSGDASKEGIKALANDYFKSYDVDWNSDQQEQDTKVGWRMGYACAVTDFASRNDEYEPYLVFKTEADETDFKNKYTELVCDRLLNHNPAGKFGSDKMQQIADIIHASRKVTVTDEEIIKKAKEWADNYFVQSYDKITFVEGAKFACEKMGGEK